MAGGEGRIAVVAVGGNSLIKGPQRQSIPDQYEAARETICHVVDLIVEGWRVVLTHGNGPQVGFALRRSELAMGEAPPVPMDYAGADVQGAVGYMFQKAFHNEFLSRGLGGRAITLVTEVLVDAADPAFAEPTKPIGSHMSEERARRIAAEQGWTVREDAGRGWRRVVPSPVPREIVELDAIVAPTGGPAWLTDLVGGDHFTGISCSTPPAVAGYPHITVPMGFVFGLPVGLSFFGPAWSEPTLLRLGYAFEQASRVRRRPRFLPAVEVEAS